MMRKKYLKPEVESETYFEQTSLACNVIQGYMEAGSKAFFQILGARLMSRKEAPGGAWGAAFRFTKSGSSAIRRSTAFL